MKQVRWVAIIVALVMLMPLAVEAQMGMRAPSVKGVWSPVVGSGSVYKWEGKSEKAMEWEMAVVGTDTVGGKPGHWLEMVMKERDGSPMVMKQLIVLDGKATRFARMIFQQGNEEPMEMSMEMMGMMGGGQKQTEKADFREDAVRVGTESITVPAGTFSCDHWRSKDQKSDFWIAEKVSPYGLVKMTSPEGNMVLMRVLTNATTKIRGTPRKFDPMKMMEKP